MAAAARVAGTRRSSSCWQQGLRDRGRSRHRLRSAHRRPRRALHRRSPRPRGGRGAGRRPRWQRSTPRRRCRPRPPTRRWSTGSPPTLGTASHVGVVVTDRFTGDVLGAHLPDQPRTPASTVKVLTALAAGHRAGTRGVAAGASVVQARTRGPARARRRGRHDAGRRRRRPAGGQRSGRPRRTSRLHSRAVPAPRRDDDGLAGHRRLAVHGPRGASRAGTPPTSRPGSRPPWPRSR